MVKAMLVHSFATNMIYSRMTQGHTRMMTRCVSESMMKDRLFLKYYPIWTSNILSRPPKNHTITALTMVK